MMISSCNEQTNKFLRKDFQYVTWCFR